MLFWALVMKAASSGRTGTWYSGCNHKHMSHHWLRQSSLAHGLHRPACPEQCRVVSATLPAGILLTLSACTNPPLKQNAMSLVPLCEQFSGLLYDSLHDYSLNILNHHLISAYGWPVWVCLALHWGAAMFEAVIWPLNMTPWVLPIASLPKAWWIF